MLSFYSISICLSACKFYIIYLVISLYFMIVYKNIFKMLPTPQKCSFFINMLTAYMVLEIKKPKHIVKMLFDLDNLTFELYPNFLRFKRFFFVFQGLWTLSKSKLMNNWCTVWIVSEKKILLTSNQSTCLSAQIVF